MFLKIFNTILLITSMNFLLIKAYNYMKEPPTFTSPCYFSSPKYLPCLKNQTQQLFNQLSKGGIPNLKTVPSLDPFYVNKIAFNQGNNNVVLKTKLTNVVIKGLKNIKVESCKVDSKNLDWDSIFLMPKLRIDADYVIDGKILIVPLKGDGKLFIELDNVRATLHANTKLYEVDNFLFYNITNFHGDIKSLTGLRTELKNLFNGNKELETSTNQFFNENWRDVFEAMKPVVRHTVEDIVLDIIKKIYAFIPANHFIPDIVDVHKKLKNKNLDG